VVVVLGTREMREAPFHDADNNFWWVEENAHQGVATIRTALIQSRILTVEEADHYSKLSRTRGVALWKILLAENKITETWLADSFSQRLVS